MPVPAKAFALVKTDLSVHTPPAFSVENTVGPKYLVQSSIVEGSDSFVFTVASKGVNAALPALSIEKG